MKRFAAGSRANSRISALRFCSQQKTQELADRAKADHDLKKAAKDLGANFLTSDFVAPDGQVPQIGSLSGQASAIFSLKQGEVSGPIVSGANGIVAKMLDKQVPTDQEFAAKKDGIRESLLDAKQNETFGLFLSSLRKDMEKSNHLKINSDEMKNLTHGQGSEGPEEGSE